MLEKSPFPCENPARKFPFLNPTKSCKKSDDLKTTPFKMYCTFNLNWSRLYSHNDQENVESFNGSLQKKQFFREFARASLK